MKDCTAIVGATTMNAEMTLAEQVAERVKWDFRGAVMSGEFETACTFYGAESFVRCGPSLRIRITFPDGSSIVYFMGSDTWEVWGKDGPKVST